MMDRPIHIFALAGDKGAGKTHIADQMEALCSVLNGGYIVKRLKFADALKNLLAAFLGSQAKGDHFKTKEVYNGLTGRELLTTVGQGLRELVHEDIWADCLVQSITQFQSLGYLTSGLYKEVSGQTNYRNPYIFIIDDLRHKNELRKLHETYGVDNVTTIRVIDPSNEGNKGSHISENDLNDVELDHVYYNPRSEPAGIEHVLLIMQKELTNKHARMENKDEGRGSST